MPRDAFDGVGGELGSRKPMLRFNQAGLYSAVDFPGDAPQVAGTSPLGAPGSGAMFRSLWDIEARMEDYEGRLGIDMHIILPQFSGWWSYLLEPGLATSMARSHNESMLRIMEKFPGKILGAALVALQDVEASIRELDWAKKQGFKSAVLDKVFQ
jgi:hypothetical protein